MPDIAVLNGRLMPLSKARVHVEDRGYTFGDGVYEVVRVYDGRPFMFLEHLRRFERSAEAIQLPLGSPVRWERLSRRAIEASRYSEAKLYLQLTRGVAPREHPFPAHVRPTMLMTVRQVTPVDEKLRRRGVRVVTMPDLRWGRCDIKSLNLLPNVLAKQSAKQRGAYEAILIRPGLGVTEGASSNLFVVTRQGAVITPPAGPAILSGITRDAVMIVAREEGLAVAEAAVSPEQLIDAAELFLSGTLTEVLPVTRCDDRIVGTGRPGPVTMQLAGALRRWIGRHVHPPGRDHQARVTTSVRAKRR